MIRARTIWIFCIIIHIAGCKDIYKPDIISAPVSYLVVEGVLNAGNGPTSIRLTRTFRLEDSARLRSERNAVVTVEGNDNITRILSMTADGLYTSPDLGLIYNDTYRLHIKTTDGKEYLSADITAKRTPVIDSIGFREEAEGVQVYVNSHDAANTTRYYRWDFDETWEIRSYYFSQYKYENGQVMDRTAADDVSVCWKHSSAKNITLGSTTALESDIVYRAPVIFIPRGDERLAVRYSILVRQYAMNKDSYSYYELMKKNTETLGTIFDAQPSEAKGNIECVTDPEEPVIGYVTASSIEERRYFISVSQLNNWKFFEDCPMGTVANNPDSIRQAYQSGQSIFAAFFSDFSPLPVFYFTSYKRCVECTARNGSLQRPSYW